MGNGRITKKESRYTQISNMALMDSTLSLGAIGLYSKINYLLSIPNWTLYKTHLMKECKEGEKAFERIWKELKDSGYLVQIKLQTPGKKQFYYEYELLDEKSHTPKMEGVALAGVENAGGGFGGSIIIQTNNTDSNNTNTNKDQSVSPTINNNTMDGRTELVPYSEEYVKESVGYDALCSVCRVHLVDAVIANMVSMWYQDSVKVKGSVMPSHVVRSVLTKISHWHVIYIIEQFESVISPIKDKVAYIQSLVYNSVMEMDIANLNRNNSLR